ncbi:hypothetical protein [Nostoc sp.]
MAEDNQKNQQTEAPKVISDETSQLVESIEPPVQRSQRRRRQGGQNIKEA